MDSDIHPKATLETLDPATGDYEKVVSGVRIVPDDSGIEPQEFKVLVLPDESEVSKAAAKANILVPDTAQGMYQAGTVTGHIVAMSPAAFSYHDWPDDVMLPKVGDRVVFARYAGVLVKGKPFKNSFDRDEQREYRLLNDRDVAAVLRF